MPAFPRPISAALSRRSFLLGAAGAAALTVCGDDGTAGTSGTAGNNGTAGSPTTSTPPTTEPPGLQIGVAFPQSGLLVTGIPQRLPFLLLQPTGGLVDTADAPSELTFVATTAEGDSIAPTVVGVRGVDLDRPYWPLEMTFPSAGVWTVATGIGSATLTREVLVSAPEEVAVPQVGQPLPALATPTVAAPGDALVICTADPICPFHEVSAADVLAAGRPLAVLVSTPAFCQVGICGPVLDLLIGAGSPIDVVHLEVYPFEPPPEGLPSPLVNDALGLTHEPALFVAGADGIVTSRLDSIYDAVELTAALASA